MNCKKGEMAFIVKSMAGNEMKVVTCVKFVGDQIYSRSDGSLYTAPSWEVDRYLPTVYRGKITKSRNVVPDAWLRPIRPGDLHEATGERKEVTI